MGLDGNVLKAEGATGNMRGPAFGWGQSSMLVQTGGELIQSNPAEKGLGILVGKNEIWATNMSLQPRKPLVPWLHQKKSGQQIEGGDCVSL